MTFASLALTSAAVADFAARPCVRAALASPSKPESVLSFFLGVDMSKPEAPEELRQGKYLYEMTGFWFGGHADYDALFTSAFAPLVRQVGNKDPRITNDSSWSTTVNGQMAQLILCDQLSRNCFRGQDEAYQYDCVANDIARALSETYCDDSTSSITTPSWEGEFYPPLASFCATALMHSESLHDHELCLKVVDWARTSSPDHLDKWWEIQLKQEVDHKQVIDRFGRYPHRNDKMGRMSTPEELQWLANDKDLPEWAQSQK